MIQSESHISEWNDCAESTEELLPPKASRVSVRTSGDDGRQGDVFSWWWGQVERFPLLTPEAEVALARRVRAGDEDAFEEMVECNLRLVVSVARRCESFAGPSLMLTDLVQEGAIGLIRAVRKFDHRLGYKFSTYATYWIRQAIMRAIVDKGRTIRLPCHVNESIQNARQARKTLTLALERPPSEPELAAHLNMPLTRVRTLFEQANETSSLDELLCAEINADTLADVWEDVESLSPEDSATDSVHRERMSRTLRRALKTLPARECEVLSMRFGLDGGDRMTLEEIATRLTLTRERIRQIEKSALNHLRRCHSLRDAVGEF